MTEKKQLTLILKKWQAGDQQALDELIPRVYEELKRLAKNQLNKGNNSIQCTELISEAYLKLIDINAIEWQNRNHFYSMAARTMRRVLVDRFRKHNTNKRGNNLTLVTYVENTTEQPHNLQLDDLEDALEKLEQFDPELSEIVTLKFYGGLTHQEIAALMNKSDRSIRRDWSVARVWLNYELNQ